MSIESLKISIAQRIFGSSDLSILEQINKLLEKKNIVGYSTDGTPIYEQEYISELDRINNEIDSGNAILSSSEDVKQRIIDENNLAQ